MLIAKRSERKGNTEDRDGDRKHARRKATVLLVGPVLLEVRKCSKHSISTTPRTQTQLTPTCGTRQRVQSKAGQLSQRRADWIIDFAVQTYLVGAQSQGTSALTILFCKGNKNKTSMVQIDCCYSNAALSAPHSRSCFPEVYPPPAPSSAFQPPTLLEAKLRRHRGRRSPPSLAPAVPPPLDARLTDAARGRWPLNDHSKHLRETPEEPAARPHRNVARDERSMISMNHVHVMGR